MNITIERAEQIREAFGHCSNVYECYSAADIVASDSKNERVFCKLELDVESIQADRRCYDNNKPWKEWLKFENEIRKRLAEIGIARLSRH